MKDTELVPALRNLKSTFKPMVCIDCTNGDDCIIHGCHLIGMAADTIANYDSAVKLIEEMYSSANTMGKHYLRDVLKLFKIYTPPIPDPRRIVYDFETCSKKVDLVAAFDSINRNQWNLITVTYGPNGYTLFFSRPARE